MTKAKLTRIPKRVLACVLAVLMVLSCLTMLPFTGFAAPTHVDLETPAVVQDGSNSYYAFGSGNKRYHSTDMADWNSQGEYVDQAALDKISELYGSTVTATDLKSPEIEQIGGTWYLYLSLMNGSRSMIVRGTATAPGETFGSFEKVLETGFSRGNATDVLQFYFKQGYGDRYDSAPANVKGWGKGTCYYYSNFLGLNYQWFTEELPMAYAPSITQVGDDYYMAYGYRNGGIWLQKINAENGLIDFSWSGNNWSKAGGKDGAYHYSVEDSYDSTNVSNQRLDPYFGQLIAHTTEAGDTDSNRSSVSRAGEEPELYSVDSKLYLQVSYGGPNNGDGYNVRSYVNDHNISANGVTIFNFEDMHDESAVDNANEGMIDDGSNRTGLKLMGDYSLPGTTNGDTYYTSPGASSVSTGDNGLLFYNYQVKFNDSDNGQAVKSTPELRSHILMHNVNGEPLVTPFEYNNSADAKAYQDAYGANPTQYDIDNQIVGQYYVTMTGNETSTTVQNYGGITLTSGGMVSGMISGTWEFEGDDPETSNYVLIHDSINNVDYHGAFLLQTVENVDNLNSSKNGSQQMTFTLVGNNQTVWGVWYDNYQPSGENNANAHLSISPAIYTGGALDLNADYLGQLGLKYGNYIAVFGFANIDYSTYLTIDENYTIESVRDQDCIDAGNQNDGIKAMPVANEADINAVAQAMYYRRQSDTIEVDKGNGADTEPYYDGVPSRDLGEGQSEDGAKLLKDALQKKLDSMKGTGQKLYVLTGWLDSDRFGRTATMDDDKGDVELLVTYKDATNDSNEEYTERVYSHVYQQPVPANISGANYIQYSEWLTGYDYVNTTFLRAEGSYPAPSTFADGTLRNYNMRGANKQFAAAATFSYYNESLFTADPDYGAVNKETYNYFHGNRISIMNDGSFNTAYRSSSNNADITVSYEQTFNAGGFGDNPHDGDFALNAGPRAEYYIDKSSPETSNIASYYSNGQYTIPLYYSTISTGSPYTTRAQALTFNYYTDANSTSYSAGLYDALNYGASNNAPVGTRNGAVYNPENSTYPFKADFSNVEFMYDGSYTPTNGGGEGTGVLWNNGNKWSDRSYSANIWITADSDDLTNETQAYGAEDQDDYNFYVRTRVDSVYRHDGSPQQLVTDMEYGIYVSDKSFLRNYYNTVMEDKLAQGYTYYSWENFRDATRLIADYLNNYMELADSVDSSTYGDTYDSDVDYQKQITDKHYDEIVAKYGTLLDVLKNGNLLDDVLNEASGDVQGMLCYLLTAAEKQLFPYEEYQNFMDAYQEYQIMLQNRGDYTASSWRQYLLNGVLGSVTVNGTEYFFEALAQYTPGVDDDTSGDIYNPTHDYGSDSLEDVNTSWKIINDEYFGGDAKAVFVAATEKLNEAKNVLRLKADYTDLQAYMDDAAQYEGDENLASGTQAGSLDDAKIDSTDQRNAGIFSIDRSTVSTLADSMHQGTAYVTDDNNNRYTISSMAAFDKVYDKVWEIKNSTTESDEPDYESKTSDKDLELTDRQLSATETDASGYYSKLIRDDQPRYAEGAEFKSDSEVQGKIDDREIWMKNILDFLQNNQITDAVAEQYATFDYLIDVISSIDFNAYTPDGQTKLWNTLYDMLVKGGVYAVNQQLFLEPVTSSDGTSASIDKDSPLYNVLYGDKDPTYYTGWNTTDVDAATTELMELLTELDETERKSYNVTFTVQYMNPDGTPANTDVKKYPMTYNSTLDLSVDGYDPTNMYAYSWVVETRTDDGNNTLTTSELRNIGGTYTYSSNNNANITVYVTRGMSDPSADSSVNQVPFVVTTRLNQRNEVALNLSEGDLGNYSVVVNGDTLSVYANGTASGAPFATVTANQLPFHVFNGWRINFAALGDGTYTLKELYDAEDGSITISNSYTLEDFTNPVTVNGKPYAGSTAANGYVQFDGYVSIDSATDSVDMPGTFYAWLIKGSGADKDLKIASYQTQYSFNMPNGDYQFVQVNQDTDAETKETVFYVFDGLSEDGTVKYKTYDSKSQYSPKGDIDELNTDSLYYRLSNRLRDSWSSISTYDETSGKVSLYSHFTAAKNVEPAAVDVVESGCVMMYNDDLNPLSESELEEALKANNPGVQKFVASSFTSTTSEGQYMMSIAFPDDGQTIDNNWSVAMRSFVTYSYYGQKDDGTYGLLYRTVYSDVKQTALRTTSD